jgi:hypothetical protein
VVSNSVKDHAWVVLTRCERVCRDTVGTLQQSKSWVNAGNLGAACHNRRLHGSLPSIL